MGIVQATSLDALTALEAQPLPTEYRLFKFGENQTTKGTFVLDAAGAESVMDSYRKHGIDMHVDYEHDRREAAAWFTPQVRADGLWATNVRWTPPAAAKLQNKEYRYHSPTFYHDDNKRITRVVNDALTNLPATDNQEPLVAASESVDLTAWSTAFVDGLPDSSFLYISPGGKKDGEGKTVPRSLRHFPVKNASGTPDLPHVRNALARIPDSNVPADVKARITAEAKRMLGTQRMAATTEINMHIGTLIGLKDDASEDAVAERVISLAAIERRLLQATGKDTLADAMTEVLSNKDAAADRDRFKALVREWEDRHEREAADDKKRQIDAIIQGAVLDGRVSLRDGERIERWRKHGEDFGPDQLKKLVAERDPRPVRQVPVAPPQNTVAAQMRAIDEWKKANPGKNAADAYVALAQSAPAMFADTSGVAVEE